MEKKHWTTWAQEKIKQLSLSCCKVIKSKIAPLFNINVLGIFLALISIKISHEIYIKEDIRKEKDTLERALVGSTPQSDGKYLDAIFQFTQDPHVYPLNWVNFSTVNRNILIAVDRFGSSKSRIAANDFGTVFTAATYLTNSDGKLTWLPICQAAMLTLKKYNEERSEECQALCGEDLNQHSYYQFFEPEKKLVHAWEGDLNCPKNGDAAKACEMARCLSMGLQNSSLVLYNSVKNDLAPGGLFSYLGWLFFWR